MPSRIDRTGWFASEPLTAAANLVRAWAGGQPHAIILAGSHAADGAVWVVFEGRSVSLSDLDFYVVLESSRACSAAQARQRSAREGLRERLLALGLAAPLEAAFLTRRDLAALPARPGTLELCRHGRVLEGDPAVLAAVPRFSPREIAVEERLLLIENRGFELLEARVRPGQDALAGLRARHAVLRTACDLGSVIALERGEYPDGIDLRLAWAGANAPELAAPLAPIWARALAWRKSPQPWASEAEEREEWADVVRGWIGLWSRHALACAGATPDPWRNLAATAARAPLRRRLGQAVRFRARSGPGPSAWNRLRHAALGTPQHRLNASAAALLLDALAGERGETQAALSPRASRALERLGVLNSQLRWGEAAARAVRLWDLWVLGGQRQAGAA